MSEPPTIPDPPPVSAPRRPLVERVDELQRQMAEQQSLMAQMASLHNAFAADVARELGLGD